ncbi:SPX domain-containing protein [Chloropicon primus]|uniref:SPX domain-containing protein n=2 Tax=Chloropicon primus TaxID=1764295 RepID=A0A5B8MIW7_9CHLO|nr:SPX domain-containing protein [Chloropicon primus]UPQ99612.1 SPX domain-containing protein [Chloropicon primus]|eukprot:QDZ20403.1 SPX domain-containing protein [Chloropicon primus]
MKFGKLLKDQISEVPKELKPKFLSYKELKKQLKGISPTTPANTEEDEGTQKCCCPDYSEAGAKEVAEDAKGRQACGVHSPGSASKAGARGEGGEGSDRGVEHGQGNSLLTPQEGAFVSKLNLEITKFNDYFIKREEELIIRVKDLADRLKVARNERENISLRSASVHLHGEIVLLLHWCELNYIGLVKILKKHDKKTGLLLRSPFLANVVRQPFCSTTILKRLVKQVEETIFVVSADAKSQVEEGLGDSPPGTGEAETNANIASLPQLVGSLDSDEEAEEEGGILKQTKVAINLWRELQKSKTPGGQVSPEEQAALSSPPNVARGKEKLDDGDDSGEPEAKKTKT